MQFSLSSTLAPPHVDLVMDGELDIFTAREVSHALREAVSGGCRTARLDLGGVTFVDVSALGVLVRAKDLLRQASASMEIVSFSPAVLRLCVLTSLVTMLALPATSAQLAEARAPRRRSA